MGLVKDYLAKLFSGQIESFEVSVPVVVFVAGTPAVQAIPQDPDRIVVTFSNAGANPILIALRQNQLPASGIQLPVNSLPYTVSVWDDGSLSQEAYFAVSLVGASTLHIMGAKLTA